MIQNQTEGERMRTPIAILAEPCQNTHALADAHLRLQASIRRRMGRNVRVTTLQHVELEDGVGHNVQFKMERGRRYKMTAELGGTVLIDATHMARVENNVRKILGLDGPWYIEQIGFNKLRVKRVEQ